MADGPLLVLTRPRFQAERFAAEARARLGGDLAVLIAPLLEIVPLEAGPLDAEPPAGFILTSENAAIALPPAALAPGAQAWCVGAATAAAARAAGFAARAATGNADDLVALLLAERPAGRLVHLRGRHARGNVAARLHAAGLRAEERVVYDQAERPLAPAARRAIEGAGAVVLPLFSPRSARLAGAALAGCATPLHLACMSAAVAEAWAGPAPAALRVAPAPSAAEMLAAIAALIDAAGAG